jgi:hypothetical protein
MSKNLTRKGLTFGAIVALVSSVFAGAPAYAADELTLVPTGSDTTNYSTLSGETFTLMTGLAPATPAGNTVQLKYQVVTTSAVTVSITNGATVTAVATKNNVTQSVTNASVYEVNATVGALQRIALRAPTVVAGTPVTATVTAFFDANNDGMMTAGEFNSPARTITWLHADDVKGSVTVATVSAGDTTVTASATLTAINLGQIASLADFKILFRTNAATPGLIPGLATEAVAVERQTDGSLKATTGSITAVLKDATFRAVVVYKGDVVANALKGVTAGTTTAVARTIATIDMVGVAANGLTNGTATQATASIAGATPITVRTNASYSIVGTVKDSSATPVVVAGAKGTATLAIVSGSAFSSSRYISVDGTNLAAGKSVDVTSGADGKFTLAIASAGLVATDSFTFTVKIQNITNVVTVTYADAQFGIIDLADLANAGGRTILKGAAYKLDVRVLDQFGDAPSETGFAFRAVNTLSGGMTGTYYSNIAADGTASFSFTDANTAAATVTHTLTIQKSKDAFANTTAAAGTATVVVVVKNTADEVKAAKVTVGQIVAGAGQASTTFSATGTQTGKANLSSLAFAAFDGRTAKTAAPALAKGYTTAPSFNTSTGVWTAGVEGAADGAAITIPVSVNDSTLAAAAIDGAPVTITGKGSVFVLNLNGKRIYGVDTLTFLADSTSTNVSVMSTVTGVTSYVITSGTATTTVKVDYTNYGTEASAIAMGTLPAQAQTGRTLGLSAVVTDKWGNVVANVPVSFTNTGVADVVSTATVLTSATGSASGKVTAGVNDIGTSFLVASFNVPAAAKTTTVSSAKSVEFGLTDGDVVSGGKRVFVNAEFAMGRTVTVTINGKRIYSKVQTTDNAVELAFTQRRAGTYTVTVRISGGLTFTERVSIR